MVLIQFMIDFMNFGFKISQNINNFQIYSRPSVLYLNKFDKNHEIPLQRRPS